MFVFQPGTRWSEANTLHSIFALSEVLPLRPFKRWLIPFTRKTRDVAKVAATIRGKFRQPEAELGFGKPGKRASRTRVAMPKAAMHEDDLSLFGENDIGLSRKVGNVEPEFISARPGYFPHQKFRFCVFAVDERHALAALSPRKRIHLP
jgi:hypothetical protein